MTVAVAVGLFVLAASLAAGAGALMASSGSDLGEAGERSATSGLVLAALAAIAAMAGAATLSSGQATPAGVGPYVLAVLAVGVPLAMSAVRHRSGRGGA